MYKEFILDFSKSPRSYPYPAVPLPVGLKAHSQTSSADRMKVKAGLTGYAQVYGKYNTTPYDKLKFDLMYIRKYSVLLDLKLIIMTPKILFLKESTEGVEK